MRVLVACEFSGIVRDAFLARGHDAVSCDLLPTERPGPHRQCDVLTILDEGWDLMIAHPTCTRLTNAGVRWLSVPPKGFTVEGMWSELHEAAEFYMKLRNAGIPRKAIENPVMHCHARALIQPAKRQIIQPWHFGEPFFKATGLELHGLPRLTDTNRLIPPKRGTDEHKRWSRVHRESPGPDRWKNRSRTYQGIADAMADQWGALPIL